MWNKGMMLRPRSSAVKRKVLRAEAQTLRCVSGTIFGREVVLEVCNISAMSSAVAFPPFALAFAVASFAVSEKFPAGPALSACNSRTGMLSRRAMARAAVSSLLATINAFALRSVR